MTIFLLLITTLSVVSGSNPDGWKEELERRLSLVEESNARLCNENEKLNAVVFNIQRENREIKRDLGKLKEQLNNCELMSDTGGMTRDSQQEEIAGSLPERPTRRIHHEKNQPVSRIIPPTSLLPVSAVAFYSYMSTNSASHLSAHHTLIYDIVQINQGNGYSKDDGVFIAPVSGIYVFHFSVCIESDVWATLEILVNGNAIGAVYEYTGWHEGSNLVISYVNAGDHVFIRTHEAIDGVLHSDARGRTSFSGWLI